jgi:hypothetical protein
MRIPGNPVSSLLLSLLAVSSSAFEYHTGGRPDVDRRAIAGLWALTKTIPTPRPPLKEFTVYPKKTYATDDKAEDVLLMLKEDGSFQQYINNDKEEIDADASWSTFRNRKMAEENGGAIVDHLHHPFLHGTWDYQEGKLILAADRPEHKLLSSTARDTLLTGRVVATYETRLQDNPAVPEGQASEKKTKPQSSVALDAHLSVPKGSVKVGKFFYPKNHPSFFEQPMYQPIKWGTVTLRQVLGALNTGNYLDEPQVIEKFKCSDFYNKTFLLTSEPIGYHVNQQPKGRQRWSIRQNKMVFEPPSEESRKAAEDAQNQPQNIRVMQVQFHANNTFSTMAGLGESILRGKFDIIGQDKDQLWMQVWRFGFGRSVSGSVYSEGRMLSQEDAKSYWGTIKYEPQEEQENNDDSTQQKAAQVESADIYPADETEQEKGAAEEEAPPLEVKGSVMIGWGIEPVPEARFIMRQVTGDDEALDEDDDNDDEEEDDITALDLKLEEDENLPDGIDLSNENSFQ